MRAVSNRQCISLDGLTTNSHTAAGTHSSDSASRDSDSGKYAAVSSSLQKADTNNGIANHSVFQRSVSEGMSNGKLSSGSSCQLNESDHWVAVSSGQGKSYRSEGSSDSGVCYSVGGPSAEFTRSVSLDMSSSTHSEAYNYTYENSSVRVQNSLVHVSYGSADNVFTDATRHNSGPMHWKTPGILERRETVGGEGASRHPAMRWETQRRKSTPHREMFSIEKRYASKFAGTGSADIDNKIEQAMDLVKSHLMYAVREEVDDLKQEIVALRDRNSRLEYENSVLKSYAPQDVLSQLSNTSTPPAPVQAPTNNSSSSGGNVALTGQATAQESTAPQQQQ